MLTTSFISPLMVDGRQCSSKCLFPLRTRRHCSMYWMEGMVSCRENRGRHALHFTLSLSSCPEGRHTASSASPHEGPVRGNGRECTLGPRSGSEVSDAGEKPHMVKVTPEGHLEGQCTGFCVHSPVPRYAHTVTYAHLGKCRCLEVSC